MNGGGLTFTDLLNLPENSVIEDCAGVLVDDGWVCSAEDALGPSEPDSLYTTWAPLTLKHSVGDWSTGRSMPNLKGVEAG